MAQTGAAKKTPDNKDFPTLYEDGQLRVFKNPSGEVFVRDVRSGTTMCIHSHPYPDGGLVFTAEGSLVEPIKVTNTIGWLIGPR